MIQFLLVPHFEELGGKLHLFAFVEYFLHLAGKFELFGLEFVLVAGFQLRASDVVHDFLRASTACG